MATAGGGGSTRTFTVRNTGLAPLTGLTLSTEFGNATDFVVTANPTAPVAGPNGSTTFSVRFTPGGEGNRATTLRLTSNDPDENPYQLTLTGVGAVPELDVEQPAGSPLANGGTVSFNTVPTGSRATLTFTLRNAGLAPLTGLSAALAPGSDPEFSVTTTPASSLAAGSLTTVRVQFAPTVEGVEKTATLRLASSDADENPYDLLLSGTGGPAAATLFNDWAASFGLLGDDALPTASPQGDGVSNLLKYAFGLDPLTADSRVLGPNPEDGPGLPLVRFLGTGANRTLRIEYLRRIGSGLDYVPRRSTTLAAGSWQPLTDEPVVLPFDGVFERVIHEEPVNTNTVRRLFGQVQVVLP